MQQLTQSEIQRLVEIAGTVLTDDQLKAFLDRMSDSATTIDGLRIVKRGVGVDATPPSGKPHSSRWYDIATPAIDGPQANKIIANHIARNGLGSR